MFNCARLLRAIKAGLAQAASATTKSARGGTVRPAFQRPIHAIRTALATDYRKEPPVVD
jgi:hypothetical protein